MNSNPISHGPVTPGYIVDRLVKKGQVTIIAGKSGSGKSSLGRQLAAVVSNREGKPRDSRVLIVDAENDHAHVRDYLRKVGARLAQVRVGTDDGLQEYTLARFAETIRKAMPSMVMLDPLRAVYEDWDVRQTWDNLAELALQADVAIVVSACTRRDSFVGAFAAVGADNSPIVVAAVGKAADGWGELDITPKSEYGALRFRPTSQGIEWHVQDLARLGRIEMDLGRAAL